MTVVAQPFRTSDDLVLEVLSNLGVFSPGQTVAPEDFSYVEGKLDSIFRMLGGAEVVYVADPDNIPAEWFQPLADIVTGECAKKFGSSGQELGEFMALGMGGGTVPYLAGRAVMALKIINRGRPTGEQQRTESF